MSKWLKENQSAFIEEFQPAHVKYSYQGGRLSKSNSKYGSQSVKQLLKTPTKYASQ